MQSRSSSVPTAVRLYFESRKNLRLCLRSAGVIGRNPWPRKICSAWRTVILSGVPATGTRMITGVLMPEVELDVFFVVRFEIVEGIDESFGL